MTKTETALTFENPEDGSALQIEMDTNGYAVTVYGPDGEEASVLLDGAAMSRFAAFINIVTKEITQ